MRQERDTLQTKANDWWAKLVHQCQLTDQAKQKLDEYCDWEQGTLGKALSRIANTDEAFVKLRDERDSIASERDELQKTLEQHEIH